MRIAILMAATALLCAGAATADPAPMSLAEAQRIEVDLDVLGGVLACEHQREVYPLGSPIYEYPQGFEDCPRVLDIWHQADRIANDHYLQEQARLSREHDEDALRRALPKLTPDPAAQH